MPKQKTHKGLAKRVRVSARGKVKRQQAGRGHLMSHKAGKRVRGLRNTAMMTGSAAKEIRDLLGK